jgi:hypothetical protein
VLCGTEEEEDMGTPKEAVQRGAKAIPMKVVKYTARWKYKKHSGNVGLQIETALGVKEWLGFSLTDPNEFAVVVDLLRNEKPLFHYDYGGGSYISTHSEDVGEEET